MKISEDTLGFIEIVDDFANNELRKKNDLALCFEIAATYSGQEELNKLIFEGKVFWNLFAKLKKTNQADSGVELIQKEFESSLIRLKDCLEEFIDKMDKENKKRFDDIYFQMTRGAVLNLSDLSHDLAKVKDLLILQKNKK